MNTRFIFYHFIIEHGFQTETPIHKISGHYIIVVCSCIMSATGWGGVSYGLSVRRASSYVEAGDQRVPRLQVYILLRALAVNALLNKSRVTATPPSAEPPSSKPLAPLVCTHSPQPYHHYHQHIISISISAYNIIH